MNTPVAKRPTRLTVLCILSFIGALYGLWSGYDFAFTNTPQEQLDQSMTELQEATDQYGPDSPIIGPLEIQVELNEKLLENAGPIGYSGMSLSLVSLVAVWLMWRLRKAGFWLYLLASVSDMVVAYLYMRGGDLLSNIPLFLTIAIALVFIILYAVSLKHMH